MPQFFVIFTLSIPLHRVSIWPITKYSIFITRFILIIVAIRGARFSRSRSLCVVAFLANFTN